MIPSPELSLPFEENDIQSTHGNEGRGDQYGADRNLDHKQKVADSQPPAGPSD